MCVWEKNTEENEGIKLIFVMQMTLEKHAILSYFIQGTFFGDPINVLIKKHNIHIDKSDFNQITDSIRQTFKIYYLQII